MAESMRRRLEEDEAARLAPYAALSVGASRRFPLGDEGRAFDYRTEFQRDRDRVVYSRSFRRLRQKAVTGVLPPCEDHRRNRLTHSLEVAQVARTVGRALRLNEDLIEAAALAHDLGQPPFGLAGVAALDDLLSGRLDARGGPGTGDAGGFRPAWQSLRVVDLLEKRYEHPGLNLTDPVREAVLKSSGDVVVPEDTTGLRAGLAPAFEAQVVRAADRLTTALADLDDALQSGAIEPARIERLRIVVELRRKLGTRYPQNAARFMKANVLHRGLTHLLVTGVILASSRTLERWAVRHRVRSPRDFEPCRDRVVSGAEIGLPPRLGGLLAELEAYLEARVRRGRVPDQADARSRRVVTGLFAAYHADPSLLEDFVLLRYKEAAGVRYLRDLPRRAAAEAAGAWRKDIRFARILADHLAGMTDAYAIAEHARLMEMGAIPIPSAAQLRREEST